MNPDKLIIKYLSDEALTEEENRQLIDYLLKGVNRLLVKKQSHAKAYAPLYDENELNFIREKGENDGC